MSRSPSAAGDTPPLLVIAAILAASALMMSVTGYSYMAGNHEVYLLEPLRRAGLASFERDWFVTQTLQYHGLFTEIAELLLRLDVARPAFLVFFLVLLLMTAWAWWRIVRALGGSVPAYLLSILLYHLLLGDRALGFYSLLQDGQFNAGNVAAVALLVGIAMWMERRLIAAGAAFGVAGAFHLNYAVAAPGIWVVLLAWGVGTRGVRATKPRAAPARNHAHRFARLGASASRGSGGIALATSLALLPSLANIALALPAKLRAGEAMPLGRFVDLYVRLRHPHHYDPLGWPWWVWAAFLAPIPLAVMGWRQSIRPFVPLDGVGAQTSGEGGAPTDPPLASGEVAGRARWRRAAAVWVALIGLQLFALLTAGAFWLGETFVQLSLWRLSPHAKLLAVSAAAVWVAGSCRVENRRRQMAANLLLAFAPPAVMAGVLATLWIAVVAPPAPRWLELWGALLPAAYALLALVVCAAAALSRRRFHLILACVAGVVVLAIVARLVAGAGTLPGQRPTPAYLTALASWAQERSPPDALFLLPPDASAFSALSRRGQVVSFKLVPQLSGELTEWDCRLREVLAVPDLSVYAAGVNGYGDSQQAMRRRYDELPLEHLAQVARRYGVRYVFRCSEDGDPPAGVSVAWRGAGEVVLYDLLPAPGTSAPSTKGRSSTHVTTGPAPEFPDAGR